MIAELEVNVSLRHSFLSMLNLFIVVLIPKQ